MNKLWCWLLIPLLMSWSIDPELVSQFTMPPLTGRPEYRWTKALEEGPWKKSYNFQLFSHHDTLWVFHTDGNWFSADGKVWRKSSLPNAIANLAFLDYIQFDGTILGLGISRETAKLTR